MDPVIDDDEAVRRTKQGDRDAYATLVTRYQEVAFRAAYLILRESGAAEDVAQDGFVRAYLALDSFREGDPFRPWLLRIVTNLALNEVRGRGRRQGLLARFGLLREARTVEPPADSGLVPAEQRGQLWEAISELSEEDSVVLYLRYYLDLPEREIAIVIGRPAGTVKSRLHRAAGRLRELIERRYPALRPEPARGGERRA